MSKFGTFWTSSGSQSISRARRFTSLRPRHPSRFLRLRDLAADGSREVPRPWIGNDRPAKFRDVSLQP